MPKSLDIKGRDMLKSPDINERDVPKTGCTTGPRTGCTCTDSVKEVRQATPAFDIKDAGQRYEPTLVPTAADESSRCSAAASLNHAPSKPDSALTLCSISDQTEGPMKRTGYMSVTAL